MKKSFAACALFVACTMSGAAQEKEKPTVNVGFDARADFQTQKVEGQDGESGFHGRYLNLKINGTIDSKWSYSWRQRMNKFEDAKNDVFAATDWIYLSFAPTDNWSFAAGKQVVAIGGYEYDAAPIDIYFASRFWNNIACYQFGASATYATNNGKHAFTAQLCNSPYQPMSSSCYAYNLMWAGRMGCLQTLWSVNLIEYEKSKYTTFIALGNKLSLGAFELDLDLMNRAVPHHQYFGRNYSVIAQAKYDLTPWMSVLVKGGTDDFYNQLGESIHHDKPFYGGGFEFYPYHGKRNIRIHAIYDQYHDNDGIKVSEFMLGLTWKVNVFSSK